MIKSIWKRVKPWWMPVSLTLFFYFVLQYVILIGYVPTSSMEPTLPQGSFIIGFRIFDEPEVGDIIVFEKDGVLLVKRVAAVPGDTVDLSQLTYMTSVPLPVRNENLITVPKGCYFVLGDNTQESWDSRYWDNLYVTTNTIIAKLMFRK